MSDIQFSVGINDASKRIESFKNSLATEFPSTKEIDFSTLTTMVSPLVLNLPQSVFNDAQNAVAAIFNRSRKNISSLAEWNVHLEQGSVLMGYDFHLQILDNVPRIKLIEINTNASGFLIGSALAKNNNINVTFALDLLKKSFLDELKTCNKNTNNPNVVIIDSKPEEQKLYLEFLMYRDLFKSWGWNAEIKDITELAYDADSKKLSSKNGITYDLVYNRWTDFYFKDTASQSLLNAYKDGVLFSPNPKEYFLLADKIRLLELVNNEDSFALEAHQINKDSDIEFVEKIKKRFIFKPFNSFGGKSVYRGDRMTRKVLDRMIEEGCMAQEYFAPGSILHDGTDWKFDLRFYAYKDQIQFCAARVFKGQIMNFQNLGSGFAPINWI